MNIFAPAKQRYAERVACKDQDDAKIWVAQNNKKAEHGILELVNHGKRVYQGKKTIPASLLEWLLIKRKLSS